MELNNIQLPKIKFDSNGLIPAIVQEYNTKTVLMLAYMDKEAILKTLTTGLATYWSRSRQTYWIKGDHSGNTQKVLSLKYDCDFDTILLQVVQNGCACHTGSYSCFIANKQFEVNLMGSTND